MDLVAGVKIAISRYIDHPPSAPDMSTGTGRHSDVVPTVIAGIIIYRINQCP